VFGQNLEDRVILPASTTTTTATTTEEEEENKREEEEEGEPQPSTSSATTSGAEDNREPVTTDNGTTTGPGTSTGVIAPAIGAGAAAAKEASAVIQKRKYEATIVTGEEDESTVMQLHCKLYQWETEESVWKEKGKGFLKLNDKKSREDRLSSRLSQSCPKCPCLIV